MSQIIIPKNKWLQNLYNYVICISMKKKFFSLLICFVMAFASMFVVTGCGNNEEDWGQWKPIISATCTTDGVMQRVNRVTDEVETKTVEKYGHNFVVDKAVGATATRAGRTQGEHCANCGMVKTEQQATYATAYTDQTKYHSDYGYKALANLENGAKMQQLYNQLHSIASEFHQDYETDLEDDVVGGVFIDEYGLTRDEVIETWFTYKNDHPLYYWISTEVYISDSEIALLTSQDYYLAQNRQQYSQMIYDGVKQASTLISADTSAYDVTLAFHDNIVENISYAYNNKGEPELAQWAHSVVGFFEKQKGVCETYARTFQLLLNFSGVENLLALGTSNEQAHMWNLVKLDDGNWYWYDLTWDDEDAFAGTVFSDENAFLGKKYNYFCVNDTQNIAWYDAGVITEESTFLDDHELYTSEGQGVQYHYDLPARAQAEYKTNNLEYRETFTLCDVTYAIVGDKKVQVVDSIFGGDLVIPEQVNYNGVTYKVVSLGGFNADGKTFYDKTIIDLNFHNTKTVHLPKTIEFIWDSALRHGDICSITVDGQNPTFTSLDGVLYTKSLFTLITYPAKKSNTEFVMNEQTVCIANWAFSTLDYLQKITISKNLKYIGVPNWGQGYLDKAPDGPGISFVNVVIGGWANLFGCLKGDKTIIIDEQNPYYMTTEKFLMSKDQSILYTRLTNDVHAIVPEGVEKIDWGAFNDFDELVAITLPSTLTKIETAFLNDRALKTIYNNSSLVLEKGSTTHGYIAEYAEQIITPEN